MKKMNLGVCLGVIIAVVCLFFETGFAATYYVSNKGNDNRAGNNENTPWKTIDKVNSFAFSDGDTILFKRGDIFSDRTLEIKHVKNLTIGDYGEGRKPLFDGNRTQPVRISDSQNVTVRNIDISGQEWQRYPSANMVFTNIEGLIIDGVYGNGHMRRGRSQGKTAIVLDNCSGVIEIKNCELSNWGPYDLPKPGTDDFMGIALTNMVNGEYKIYDNKIYNINSDGIHVSLTKANGEIYNNVLYNAGADAIGIKGSENCVIFENEFYRTAEFQGEGGKGSGGLPTYINLDRAGDRFSRNNTISANTFRDGDSVAIKLGNAEDTRIYENKFTNVKSALYIQDMVKDTMFHHNIIEHPQSRMTSSNIDAGGIFENNSGTGTQINYNTIYNGQGNCKHLIALANSNETVISNNIVYQNESSEDSFGLYYNPGAAEPVISNNYWYNPGKIMRTMYSNKIFTANMQQEWNEKHPGDKFGNPLLNDPEEGDYSLYEKKLKLGAVYDATEGTVAEADGSADASDETSIIWYVRPASENFPSGNGETYETAWKGFDEIIWGNYGVKPGDTLLICGIHSQQLIVSRSGEPNKHITISGDFEEDPGVIDMATGIGIVFDNQNYLNFKKLTIKNANMGIKSNTGIESDTGCNNIVFEDCSFFNLQLKGIHLYSANPNYYVEDIMVSRCTFSNIGEWGNTGANSLTYAGYSRNTTTQDCIFEGNGNDRGVDGILIQNIAGNGSNHIIRRNIFNGHEENCIDLKHVVQSNLNEGRTKIYENSFSSSEQLEIVLHWGTQGIDILRNKFYQGRLAIGLVKHDGINNQNGDMLIAYNIFENFSDGLLMDSHSEGIGQNVFLNNTCWNIGSENSSNYSIQIATSGWKIYNNIFYLLSQGKTPYSVIRFLSDSKMETIEMSNNLPILVKNKWTYRIPGEDKDKYITDENNKEIGDLKGITPFNSPINPGEEIMNMSKDKGLLIRDFHPTIDCLGEITPSCDIPDIGAVEFDCN